MNLVLKRYGRVTGRSLAPGLVASSSTYTVHLWQQRKYVVFGCRLTPPQLGDAGRLDGRLKAAEATSDRLLGRAHACMGPRISGRQGAVLSHEPADRLERLVRGSASART